MSSSKTIAVLAAGVASIAGLSMLAKRAKSRSLTFTEYAPKQRVYKPSYGEMEGEDFFYWYNSSEDPKEFYFFTHGNVPGNVKLPPMGQLAELQIDPRSSEAVPMKYHPDRGEFLATDRYQQPVGRNRREELISFDYPSVPVQDFPSKDVVKARYRSDPRRYGVDRERSFELSEKIKAMLNRRIGERVDRRLPVASHLAFMPLAWKNPVVTLAPRRVSGNIADISVMAMPGETYRLQTLEQLPRGAGVSSEDMMFSNLVDLVGYLDRYINMTDKDWKDWSSKRNKP